MIYSGVGLPRDDVQHGEGGGDRAEARDGSDVGGGQEEGQGRRRVLAAQEGVRRRHRRDEEGGKGASSLGTSLSSRLCTFSTATICLCIQCHVINCQNPGALVILHRVRS